jgi:hypothetical protein
MRIFVAAAVTITSAIGLGTINRRIWLISRPAGPGKQPNATKTIAAVKFFARSDCSGWLNRRRISFGRLVSRRPI